MCCFGGLLFVLEPFQPGWGQKPAVRTWGHSGDYNQVYFLEPYKAYGEGNMEDHPGPEECPERCHGVGADLMSCAFKAIELFLGLDLPSYNAWNYFC